MVKVRSWAGLDVHARSVVAVTLDAESGELRSARLPGENAKVVEFLGRLPGPTRVAYEAGPTGYGLARALDEAGIGCVVAAPGKIERPAQDRVKTDQRDAERRAGALREQLRRDPPTRSDHQDRLAARPPTTGRGRLALPQDPLARHHPAAPPRRAARPHHSDLLASPATAAPRLAPPRRTTRQTPHDRRGRRRPRTRTVLLGARTRRLTRCPTPRRSRSGGTWHTGESISDLSLSSPVATPDLRQPWLSRPNPVLRQLNRA
jgi:hypothetical protein